MSHLDFICCYNYHLFIFFIQSTDEIQFRILRILVLTKDEEIDKL